MLNKEKYLDDILSIFIYNNCSKFYESCFDENCFGRTCSKCKFSTVEKIFTWLNEEYEYGLLKNGDSLKPGDLIMVRDDYFDEWKEEIFLCYMNNYFITGTGRTYTAWNQARLPDLKITNNVTLTTSGVNENEK